MGSCEDFAMLWAEGIDCFDIDILVTKDGVLLVSHPQKLQEIVKSPAPDDVAKHPEKYDHSQIVNWGGSEDVIPTLETVLREFARLIRDKNDNFTDGYVSDPSHEPVLLLDFKGAAFDPLPVVAAIKYADNLNILHHVMVWILDNHPQAGKHFLSFLPPLMQN